MEAFAMSIIYENFAAIAALIGVIVGGLLGAIGTYLAQSKLLNKQREWQLDDQRRRWRREELDKLSTHIRQLTKRVGVMAAKVIDGVDTKMDHSELLREINELGSLMTYQDEELTKLVDKYIDIAKEITVEIEAKNITAMATKPLFEINRQVIGRLEELIKETFR
jgi:hypothetical protein